MTVFMLGIADTIRGTGHAVAVAVLFVLPILIVMFATPWVLWALSIMSVLGSARKNRSVIQKIVRESRGQYENSDEDDAAYSDLDDDDKPTRDRVIDKLKRNHGKRPANLSSSRPLIPDDENKDHEKMVQRPLWLDDDEEWDGKKTLGVSTGTGQPRAGGRSPDDDAGGASANLDFLYYDNVDGEDFDRIARKIAPELVHEALGDHRSAPNMSIVSANEERLPRATRSSDGKGRPIWAESDEDFDI